MSPQQVAQLQAMLAVGGISIGELHQSAEFMGVSLATEQYLLPIVAGAHHTPVGSQP